MIILKNIIKSLLDELKSKLSCPTYEKLEELYYTAKKIKK